jgi:hypothetical protein
MSARILHCPNCGDLWKRIRHERFIRLGAPLRQCRACNSWHDSEHAEWATLTWGRRIGFLAQNVVHLLPPALLFLAGVVICQLLAMAPQQDLFDYSLVAGMALLGFLALLLARSVWQVVLSLARTRRGSRQTKLEQVSGGQFITDAIWQASIAVRPRFPALQPPAAAPAKREPQREPQWEPQREIAADSRFLHPA